MSGRPEAMHSFGYDRFQQEAIDAIRRGVSVFVSAPTGAGKTVIAEIAVSEAMKAGGMAPPPVSIRPKAGSARSADAPLAHETGGGVAIYTAPIKALSNQKFRDFYAVYGDKVGILTGDLTLNPDADLLIMTTEIYRNRLFENKGRFARCRWVIFDEVHYLDDPERGTVWEEALLLTPRKTEILALSATIPNARQIAGWIEKIHGRPVKVVEETHRPVPLKFAFQCQNEIYQNLGSVKAEGYRGMERVIPGRRPFRMRRARSGRYRFRAGGGSPPDVGFRGKTNRADVLLKTIREQGHLPCLYFAFSRKRVEELAWEFGAMNFVGPAQKDRLLSEFDRLCERYQIRHERSAAEMRQLVGLGVAYHHAGLLPTLKEVVEILFTSRLIQVIVTTETFALGVNMPARSVVLDTLVRRMEGPRAALRVRELWQMAGRAGRRGMDEQGFVYLRVNPWEIPYPQVAHLVEGRPEQVSSRFSLTYATILNLYQSYEQDLFPFYQKTLHAFQAPQFHQREVYAMIGRKLALLQKLGYIAQGEERLTRKGKFALSIYGYELLLSELFQHGILDRADVTDLGILLTAVVYEPRRGMQTVRLPHRLREMVEGTCRIMDRLHHEERRSRIYPMTKPPAFHLAQAAERWIGGASFDKTVDGSGVEEGELIRYFRMAIQLARALAHAKIASDSLKKKATHLLSKMNRDAVDAEAELRLSL